MAHSRSLVATLVLLGLLAAWPATAAPTKVLFDNLKGETAGNADWIIDTDQPLPIPDQSTVTAGTARTYWLGAISSWGIDLVKRGFQVATLGSGYPISYGNAANAHDLSKYDVFVLPEPNSPFSAAESIAIFNYVRDGGGLIVVTDHNASDRNGDGWDSPEVYNALDATRLWGIHAGTVGDANNNIVQTSTNVNASLSDSIIRGPVGNVTGLAFHNGTTFTLYPALNPTVRGEVWMTGVAQGSTTSAMAASAVYGNGRVVVVGDSSPMDDGSAQPGNSSIFDGWGEAGATDSTLFMNAVYWAARRGVAAGDTQAPVVNLTAPNGGEVWKAGATRSIQWTASDNVGVSAIDIDWSTDGGASWSPIAAGLVHLGLYAWTVPNTPTTTARVRVTARDAAGNFGSDSSSTDFTVDRWIITATAGAGGTIAPAGAVPVLQGSNQAFTIAPAAGQHVAGVLVDGAAVGALAGYTFNFVVANHTIAASFAPDSVALQVTTVGAGTVSRTPDLPSYPFGTPVRLLAVPDAGWGFAGWSGDTAGTVVNGDTLFVTVDGARSITATFADAAAPLVALLAPVGGERWRVGDLRRIRWTATDNVGVDSVQLEVSYHGAGGPWETLLASGAAVDSLDWVVPDLLTDSALVRVTALDLALHAGVAVSDSVFHILAAAGVGTGPRALAFALPSPNPAHGAVRLAFTLPVEGAVTVEVLDIGGRRVALLAHGVFPAGPHALRWDGRDGGGARATAGVYFARLVTRTGAIARRFVRID